MIKVLLPILLLHAVLGNIVSRSLPKVCTNQKNDLFILFLLYLFEFFNYKNLPCDKLFVEISILQRQIIINIIDNYL